MLPSFLLDYTRPRDLRWQASQRFILPLILVKYVLYVPFVAVSIAEIVLFRKWINYGDEDSSGWYSVYAILSSHQFTHEKANAL